MQHVDHAVGSVLSSAGRIVTFRLEVTCIERVDATAVTADLLLLQRVGSGGRKQDGGRQQSDGKAAHGEFDSKVQRKPVIADESAQAAASRMVGGGLVSRETGSEAYIIQPAGTQFE